MGEPSSTPVGLDPDDSPAGLRPAQLQFGLAALCAVAALACLRALLLPPWPQAQPLPPQRFELLLNQAAVEPRRLPSLPPRRSEGLALSAGLAWRLPAAGELRLAAVSLRRWDDAQVAWITRGLPLFSLQQRRLDHPQTGVASGRLQGRPAFQTCLVPQGASPATPAVSLRALQQAIDRQPRSRADQLATLLGLRRSRQLGCLLVTLQSSTAEPPPVQTWQRLLAGLQGFSIPPQRP